jgi:hypothetical protein
MQDRRMPELDQQGATVKPPLPTAMLTALSSPSIIRSFSLSGLFVLAIFYTLYFAADFVLPVALAVLMSFLLLPRASGFPQRILEASWSRLRPGRAVDGLRSDLGYTCRLQTTRIDPNLFQSNVESLISLMKFKRASRGILVR